MPDTTKRTATETVIEDDKLKAKGEPDALADPLSDPLTLQLGTSTGGGLEMGDDDDGASIGLGGVSVGRRAKDVQVGMSDGNAELAIGEVRQKGWNLDDAYAEMHSGDTSVSAKVGHAGKGPHARDIHARVGSDGLDVGAGKVGWGGQGVSGVELASKTADSETVAALGSHTKGVSIQDSRLQVNGKGVSAEVGEVSKGMDFEDVSLSHKTDDSEYSVSADSISTRQGVKGAGVTLGEDGLRAKADEVSVGSLELGGLGATIKEGDKELSGGLGSFTSSDTVKVEGASAEVDSDGVRGKVDKVQYGGFDIADASLRFDDGKDSSTEMRVGALGNSNAVEDAAFAMDSSGIKASAKSIDHGSTTLADASLTHESEDLALSAKAGEVKKVGAVVKGATAESSWDGSSGKLGAEEVTVGGLSVQDASAGVNLKNLDTEASASLGSLSTSTSVKDAEVAWDASGVRAKAGEVSAMGMDIEKAKASLKVGSSSLEASVDELHTGLLAEDVEASITEDGIKAKTGAIQYRVAEAKGISLASDDGMGLSSASVKADEASFKKISAESTSASITRDGIEAGATGLDVSLASGKGVAIKQKMLGMEQGIEAGTVEVAGGSADELSTKIGLDGIKTKGKNVEAHALEAEDVGAWVKSGDAELGASAKKLVAGKVSAEEIESSSDLTGLVQSASIKGFKVTVIDTDDARVGLKIADREVLALQTDASLTGSAKEVSADLDAFKGKASMSVKDATAGVQLNDSSINVMGSEIAIPDMGAAVKVNASTEADVTKGKLKTHTSLAGSSANFAGMEVEMGEWAQAGADIDISKGQLNLNVGGMEIDVDKGLKQAGDFISSFF